MILRVLGISAIDDKTIVTVACFRLTIIQAEGVSTLKTIAAMPAAFVSFTRYPISNFEFGDSVSNFDNLASPFMSRYEWIRRGPNPREAAPNYLRVTTTNGDPANFAKYFLRAGDGNIHFLQLKFSWCG
jgi:hypothetical protein